MATGEPAGRWRLTPARIGLIYLVGGGLWIVLSDATVAALPLDPGLASRIQTVKGWLFVGVSAVLIYGLVSTRRTQLEATNRELERTVQQSTVLHRVLRHNLRNACNAIALGASELADRAEEAGEPKAVIERQVDGLVELAEKSKHMRRVSLDGRERGEVDLVSVVEREVERARGEHPDVTVTLETPGAARVRAYPEVEFAVRELLENAVEHGARPVPGDRGEPDEPAPVDLTIDVDVARTGDAVTVTVADDGPGLPAMEREVLERGLEQPLHHSQGLGLWIVRVIVAESGGDLRIDDNEPSGTVVSFDLEAAGSAPRLT